MELGNKDDWQQAEERMRAWWRGEIVDRAAIQVTAPRADAQHDTVWSSFGPMPEEVPQEQLLDWFTDPGQVIPRLEGHVEVTYWGGESFPVVFPVSTSTVAITSAYLGCPYEFVTGTNSGWAHPIIRAWDDRPTFKFDPDSEWWLISKRLLETAAARATGRYYVGIPDLNGPGEILARLRGTQQLALDLIENPEHIRPALEEINLAWLRYWQAATGVVHQWVDGFFYWIGIWSDRPSVDLQCDFSCLISPQMFEEFFLPTIEQQTHWVERTVYHLDGPGAIRHLDLLLSLPELDCIQWIPGAGAPPVSRWIRLLRRIQSKGKLIQLYCEPWEVEVLLSHLEPEGLLLTTSCRSEEQAKDLLSKVARWTAPHQWLVP
ncbi:MAG: hypothetical protein PVI63_03415 [Anaerolineae bacterium]|jgi:hypothetical protein